MTLQYAVPPYSSYPRILPYFVLILLSVLDAFEGYDLEGVGSISRDNLRQMFKAYFYVTIELVRDVVKACEEEMVSFNKKSSKFQVSSIWKEQVLEYQVPMLHTNALFFVDIGL